MDEQPSEKKLILDEDYYLSPEGYKIFTEKFHLKRGYCCTNGCKHCPYQDKGKNKQRKNLSFKNKKI